MWCWLNGKPLWIYLAPCSVTRVCSGYVSQDEGTLVTVKDNKEQIGYDSVYNWFISQGVDSRFFSNF